MANGQSRVGIGSFLEELQDTIGDNIEEPKESLLETITKPRYEVPGLSAYSRAVGKLSKILDAPVEKRKKRFKELGVSIVQDPTSGMSFPSVVEPDSPLAGEKGSPMPSTTLSMLAPLSGDPETGEYSYLDIAFGGLESLGAVAAISKGMTRARRSAGKFSGEIIPLDDSPVPDIDLSQQPSYPSPTESFDSAQRAERLQRILDERLNPSMDRAAISQKNILVEEGKFQSTGKPELEHLEILALEDGFEKGVSVLEKGEAYKGINLEELPEGVGLIVQRRRELGQGINRDIVIGRQLVYDDSGRLVEGVDKFIIDSVNPDTGKSLVKFEFKLQDYNNHILYKNNPDPRFKGMKVVDEISWFGRKSYGHSGQLLSDFINFAMDNNYVIIERSMTWDSFYVMMKSIVREKAEIIFDSSRRELMEEIGGGARLGVSKKKYKIFIDEKGDFSHNGLDEVFETFDSFIESARAEGRVVGDIGWEKLDKRTSYPTVTTEGRSKIEQEIIDRGEVRLDVMNDYPELKGKELEKKVNSKVEKELERKVHKIESSAAYHLPTETESAAQTNLIAIKKLAGVFSGFLGMSTDDLLEFLSYDPKSMESQVFDNEISF